MLSLDGGGMRGSYTATYLAQLSNIFAQRRGAEAIDLGGAFDLIVGTSTGAIIAICLAADIPLETAVNLYRSHGRDIFRRRLPSSGGISLVVQLTDDLANRSQDLATGTAALRRALQSALGSETLGQLFQRRRIALAIPAIEMSQHRSWVFKTPHFPAATSHRDDHYQLVDVCLATSAAPIYRSLAAIQHPDGQESGDFNVFVDGGLWANNPVLVALVEALDLAEANRPIEIFCIGTCPMPAGEQIRVGDVHRGLAEWKFGGVAANLSVDAQEFAYDHMARKLTRHLKRECEIIRFPRDPVPAALMPYLELDDTRPEAIQALINQARTDAQMTNSKCSDPGCKEGRLVCSLFMDAPVRPAAQTTAT